MKKNISINLFGTLYAIDEDAYQLLESYLDNMRAYFSKREGGEEIVDDVEHRVAELFNEMRQKGIQAINIDHVKAIMERIGDPQQMTAGETEAPTSNTGTTNQTTSTATPSSEPHTPRRLYRDLEDKILGGVISGICHYFGGSDPLLWRIIVVMLFFFGYGVVGIIYLILWLVVPQARTAEDRLRMQGKPVNAKAINEEVMRGAAKAKETLNNVRHDQRTHGCLTIILYTLLIIIGLILFLPLISTLMALIAFIGVLAYATITGWPTLATFGFHERWVQTMIEAPGITTQIWIAALAAIIVLIIPLFVIIRLFISRKGMGAGTIVTLIVTWLLALTTSITMTCLSAANFEKTEHDIRHREKTNVEEWIQETTEVVLPSDTLEIDTTAMDTTDVDTAAL